MPTVHVTPNRPAPARGPPAGGAPSGRAPAPRVATPTVLGWVGSGGEGGQQEGGEAAEGRGRGEGGDGGEAGADVCGGDVGAQGVRGVGAGDEGVERAGVLAAIGGEGCGCGVGAEEGLVEAAVAQPAFGEGADDAAEREPGVGLGERGPHVRAACGDVLGERRGDQVRAGREVAVDRRDAEAGAPGDLAHRQVDPVRGERRAGDRDDVAAVVRRVHTGFPSHRFLRASHFGPIRISCSIFLPTVGDARAVRVGEVTVIMRAVRFDRFGPPEVLGVGEVAEPHAGEGEVRIAVRAAGVSPVDLALRAGTSPSRDGLALPHVPGVDAAGVVDEVGPGVSGVALGDEVFGAVDIARLGGASARFAVLAFWAAKPAAMPWQEAGGAATGVETATRALDLLEVGAGATLLVDGATGGVGSIAVLLAAARGARVVGTGSPAGHAFLAGLGAAPVAHGPGLADRVPALGLGPVHRALDVAGAGSLDDLIALTGGDPQAVVTLADFTGSQRGVRVSLGRYGGQPDGRHGLADAAALAAEGRLRVPVQAVFPAERAAEAHAAAGTGPRRGKTVLDLTGLAASG